MNKQNKCKRNEQTEQKDRGYQTLSRTRFDKKKFHNVTNIFLEKATSQLFQVLPQTQTLNVNLKPEIPNLVSSPYAYPIAQALQ